jgi:hypothetical protein
MAAGHKARAGWRAHRAGGIGAVEAHAFAAECVNIGRFVEGAAAAAQISPAHVIHKNEYNVWLLHKKDTPCFAFSQDLAEKEYMLL